MKDHDEKSVDEQQASEELVVDYLKANPGFFTFFPELLTELEIPHDTGQAVSMVERQVQMMREENKKLRARFKELLDVAGENEALIRSMHRLTLQLMEASSPEQIFTTLQQQLAESFAADSIIVRIFAAPAFMDQAAGEEFVAAQSPLATLFADVLNAEMPFSGRLKQEQHQALFGEEGENKGSVVMVPLHTEHWRGMLVVGSNDSSKYQPGMGVDLLIHMGDVLSLILDPWVRRTNTPDK
jgi:hypothetical protein